MAPTSNGSGVVVLMLDNLVKLVVSAADVGGKYTVADVTAPVGGTAPVLHTHPPAECFFTLSGTLTVFRATESEEIERVELPAGRATYVPSGVAHTFANRGEAPARFLVISDGDLMERFFLAAGLPVDDPDSPPAVDPDRLGEIASRARAAGETLGFSFLGPVLEPSIAGASS